MTCTILLKKLSDSAPDQRATTFRRKLLKKKGGEATFFPYSSSRNMERKPGVEGGSKWTYEATFHIAMKGGRDYYTTAANEKDDFW